jgi:glycosyltransferase involved in cell wall biosynthesis
MADAKPRLLYVLHQYGDPGGAELQTELLVRRLCDRYEIATAYLDHHNVQIVLRSADGVQTRYKANEAVEFYPLTRYVQPGTKEGLAALLRDFRPDLIHVQSFVFWPLSLMDQLVESGARTIATLHDYYAITPIYTLQGAAKPEDVFTAEYVKEQLGANALQYMIDRRAILGRSLARVNRRIVVSEFQREILSRIYPLVYECIEPGIEPFEPLPKSGGAGFRFGFLGTLLPQKGWPELVQAFGKVRRKHPKAELRLYGRNPAGGVQPRGVAALGEYGSADLPRIMSEFDVGMIPSVFPETFSIVLSELRQGRVPVGVSDIGTLSTRVIDGVNGKKFPPCDIDAMATTMNWFIENDQWRSWEFPKVSTADEMTARHDEMYRSLMAGSEEARMRGTKGQRDKGTK